MAGAIETLKTGLINALPLLPIPEKDEPAKHDAVKHKPDVLPKAPENEFYEIRAVDGKGYGCFALKDLKRGTRILSDVPILTVSNGDYLKSEIEEAFSKMSAEEKEQYRGLASAHGQDPKKWPSRIHESVKGHEILRIKEQHEARIAKEPSLLSIFQNNCMEMGKGAGIFVHAARFNHSCNPNACFNWNENIQRETIHIIHDVKEGGEITISYCDMTHEKTLRAWELKHYGFACDCRVCTSEEDDPEGFGRQSVERRYRISELDQTTSYLRGANILLGVKEPEFVKQLLELAVLHMEIGDYSMRLASIYIDLALACEAAEDYAHGRDMAANGFRIKRDCQGEDAPEFEKYKGIVKRLNRKYKAAMKKKEEEEEEKKKAQNDGAEDEDI